MSLYIQTDDHEIDSLSTSPSPHLTPSPVNSCFSPTTRSFSGFSTSSSQSSYSNVSSSAGSKATTSTSASSKRRGYVRPQGATFAPSAKNRESVMSLGSIAHLQYYFARTGLLDGRSGQMVKTKENGEYDIPKFQQRARSDTFDTPIHEEGELLWEAAKEEGEDIMLPPTVSTYRNGQQYVPPPPSQQTLKRELVECLENALQALEASEKATKKEESPSAGFYQIQGLQILDTTTLAIRAARQYYMMHPDPKRLNSLKADRNIRKELYDVLEVLKKAASRNFAGGLREDESLSILIWVSEIGMMIDQESKLEEAEKTERSSWLWMDDSEWVNNEFAREVSFLDFLLQEAGIDASEKLSVLQSTFWTQLVDGKKLIRMHNAAVRKSKRQFGYIEKCHEDTGKPYRRAENIRYWLKAAELRFELKLKMDVLGTVTADGDTAFMNKFEETVMQWSKRVREDLSHDWNGEEERKLHARAKNLALASPQGSPSKVISKKTNPTPLIHEEVSS